MTTIKKDIWKLEEIGKGMLQNGPSILQIYLPILPLYHVYQTIQFDSSLLYCFEPVRIIMLHCLPLISVFSTHSMCLSTNKAKGFHV